VLIRAAIRRLLRNRRRREDRGSDAANRAKVLTFVEQMKCGPIALRTDSANAQHQEVPAFCFQERAGVDH
jgi:cyclopropane-fatty-acyl-phospholipid synthase